MGFVVVVQDLDFDAEKYVSLVDIPSVYQPWEAGRDQGVEDGVKLPHVIPVESADARVPAPVKTPRAVHKRARKEPTFVPESVKPSEPVESESTRLLMLRWRMPSLSVHSIRTSSTLSSVIPARATGVCDLLIVTNQYHRFMSEWCGHCQ